MPVSVSVGLITRSHVLGAVVDLTPKQQKKADERYLAVLRDQCALLDGWKCPICKKEFRSDEGCGHGWKDVKAANDKFLIQYMRGR